MMVTFVSQCEKKALKRTRRVLDAFAERIGDNTWQTVITADGLKTVKKMLRQSATKNTAVACHWIRSRSRCELVWVVGKRNKFNQHGVVPVNSTSKNIAHHEWESHWDYASVIQIASIIAALLHDLGKATIGFQNKLTGKNSTKADPYRHEWLSLKLFIALVEDCKTDQAWLQRFANLDEYLQANPEWFCAIKQSKDNASFKNLPPLARLIGWLIVSHHRLPLASHKPDYMRSDYRKNEREGGFSLKVNPKNFYECMISARDGWVKNKKNCEDKEYTDKFWSLQAAITNSQAWQKKLTRWANKALNHASLWTFLKRFETDQSPNDPFIWYLARLCLMVGDHNYSSLSVDSPKRVKGDQQFAELAANTDKKSTRKDAIKQTLDEHLIGVGEQTASFAYMLPQLPNSLPKLNAKHWSFLERTSIPRFKWQNKSIDLISRIQKATESQGFFGVNMASTGCGKTLANAKIMHGLGGQSGSRFTIALSLRVLTLQTGDALKQKLNLTDDELAILVGGKATKALYELQSSHNIEQYGSESADDLVKETLAYDEGNIDESQLGTIVADNTARQLLYSPLVSCTIDHIISASECIKGGRYIAPALRLLTSDLILDEPDEFGQSDLPALTRLVHLAGMFGSRVLLSSATLTPDMVVGLFKAYQAGRQIYNQHTGQGNQPVRCAWFDEKNQMEANCEDGQVYQNTHEAFVQKRVHFLQQQSARRRAEILTVSGEVMNDNRFDYDYLARLLLQQAKCLHDRYHVCNPDTHQTASIGIIRIANIEPLIRIAKAMYQQDSIANDTTFHVCSYHARQLLVLRSELERRLDQLLNREQDASLFDHTDIQQAMRSTHTKHHVFIVLATPVAEVGRNHDYDWAIIEPSSMRSIIQLVGRVWRHRPDKVVSAPNVMIMNANIKALKEGSSLGIGKTVYDRPGYESQDFKLDNHDTSLLIPESQLQQIDSTPRISKSDQLRASERLADLEHAVLASLLNTNNPSFVNAFWNNTYSHRAWAHLQLISPFREDNRKQTRYFCFPDPDTGQIRFYTEDEPDKSDNYMIKLDQSFNEVLKASSGNIRPWLTMTVNTALTNLAKQLNNDSIEEVAKIYATVDLNDIEQDSNQRWLFHPYLGFWP